MKNTNKNGLCVFLTSENVHINWLSVFLQLLIPILCLNVSSKEHHVLESVISNLIVVLFDAYKSANIKK